MAQELKDTLNLPQTDFPMRANLATREVDWIAQRHEAGLYCQIQKKNEGGNLFLLHDGPPFTNGNVHIGTALNKILKDAVCRYKSMRGFRVPYVPGWDCHGLPIEHKVTKELRDEGKDLEPLTLRKKCAEFSASYIQKQQGQFQRLGVLADWENAYRTMEPKYEAEILRTFAAFVREGVVYRSKKPVYWSIPCETALAEGEIEYKEHHSPSIWVAFSIIENEASQQLGLESDVKVVIWTTTPWTLPANQAIAVNPELEYVELECSENVYLVAKARAEDFIKSCNLENIKTGKSHIGSNLQTLQAKHPFINRIVPFVLADYVTTDSGTGCVHTAPGHGLEDYVTGLKNNLPIYCPLDDQAAYVDDGEIPQALVGLHILDKKGANMANKGVMALLKEAGALVHNEVLKHQYPYCWRSKTPVIFRATDQWFVSLDKKGHREKVLDAIGQVNWVPQWGEARIRGAVESRPDWCISRQRSWGTPIPVFYDEEKNPLLDTGVIEGIAKKVADKGTNIWFEESAESLLEGIDLPRDFQGKKLAKGTDTLDVWIDSGSSHQAVLKQYPNLGWPADLYLEGSDQHRGWFQSSIWTGVVAGGQSPYKQVITHGFVVNEDKTKISKSDSRTKSALEYVDQYGADILRLWICSEDYQTDIPLSNDIIKQVVQTYRTIRNTLKFQLGNLYDFDIETNAIAPADMNFIDQWALHQTNKLIEQVTEAYDVFAFHRAYQHINRFCIVVLSAIYHDILKDRLYTYAPNWQERRSSQTAIYHIFSVLTRLLAPILTFTTDEAYQFSKQPGKQSSIHLEDWPSPNPEWSFESVDADMVHLLKCRDKVNEQLEDARQKKVLGQSLDAQLLIVGNMSDPLFSTLKKYEQYLPEVFIVSQVTLEEKEAKEIHVSVKQAGGKRCPRSWRWVPELEFIDGFGEVSPRCKKALEEKLTMTHNA